MLYYVLNAHLNKKKNCRLFDHLGSSLTSLQRHVYVGVKLFMKKDSNFEHLRFVIDDLL